MTDRPPDHEHVVADRPPTDQRDQPVPLADAAAALGITVNAVRQRIKRGTLLGVRTAAGWSVVVERPTDHPRDRPPTDHRPTTTDHAPSVDLAPLAGLIERQGAEIRRLTEAATVWQLRALHAEDRLRQVTAGDRPAEAPEEPTPAPGAAAGPTTIEEEPTTAPRPPWWRRLLWGDR